jgi:hypothetical protein
MRETPRAGQAATCCGSRIRTMIIHSIWSTTRESLTGNTLASFQRICDAAPNGDGIFGSKNGQPRPGVSPAGAVVSHPNDQDPSLGTPSLLHWNSAKGPVSRILSCAVIPLDAALPRTFISDLPGGFGNILEPPERIGPMRNVSLARGLRFPPYLVLLRVGFTLPRSLQAERCALTAPFHPYPSGTGRPGKPVGSFRKPSKEG